MSLTREQLLERKSGIGGSDAPAVLGVSKWATPLAVYTDKVSPEVDEREPSQAMKWGSLLEDIIAVDYATETGCQLIKPTRMFRSKDYPFMLANIDRLDLTRNRGVEIKTAGGFNRDEWGDPGTDQVPPHYLVQVYHYAIVTGIAVWDVRVLFGGQRAETYTVHATDADVREQIIEGERAFWRRVETRTPPPIRTRTDIDLRYAQDDGTEIAADLDVLRAHRELLLLSDQRNALDEQMDDLRDEIRRFMGVHSRLTYDGQTLVTWKTTKPRRNLDVAALRKAHPELAETFSKLGNSTRRFVVNNV